MGTVEVVGTDPGGASRRRTACLAAVALVAALLVVTGGGGQVGAQAAPTLTLVKTVGTSGDDCSETDSLAVPRGAKVFYCYTATNTGTTDLTTHDLDDDKLGELLDQYEYGLTAGQSLSVTASATIFEDTVNVGTWDATDEAAAHATGTDTASVDVDEELPGAPTITSATAQEGRATVVWTAPTDDGGSPVTGYEVRAQPDAPGEPIEVPASGQLEADIDGLANGITYTFTVAAVNAEGTGLESDPSAPVTPQWWLPWSSGTVAVQELFTWMTGKPPTAAEQTSWLGQLNGGAALPGDLVANLRTQPDALNNVDPVVRLYSAYFLRVPDPGGLAYWIGRKRTGTLLATISSTFAGSQEFKTRYGALTNRQFVELVYQNVLGRAGDPGGIAYWTGRLDSKTRTRGQVMIGFSESNEHKQKQADKVTATVVFIHLLGRKPTAAERDALAAELAGATPLRTVVRRELRSPAFATRAG
jgi:hypothetical protein